MVLINEDFHDSGFLVSEANHRRSREQVTIVSGQNLKAGAVLGQVALAGATAQAGAGNTGDGVMGAITVSAGAKLGVYKLTIIEPATNAGTFEVEDPDGVQIGTGAVAAAFSAGGLAFTLADGATDFAAGDTFDITVAAGSGEWRELNLSGTDGSQRAAGILLNDVDATAAAQQGAIIIRDAEVNASELVYPSGISGPQTTQANAELSELGIILR